MNYFCQWTKGFPTFNKIKICTMYYSFRWLDPLIINQLQNIIHTPRTVRDSFTTAPTWFQVLETCLPIFTWERDNAAKWTWRRARIIKDWSGCPLPQQCVSMKDEFYSKIDVYTSMCKYRESRNTQQTHLEGTGIPLEVKSFRKAQPQLSSPLSPVD